MKIDYEDERVRVGHLVVGPIDNNVYFVTCRATNHSMMIDAASEGGLLIETARSVAVETVVQTHGHWDHIGAVPAMRKAGFPIAVGVDDASALPEFDTLLRGGETLTVGDLAVTTIHTPGHTPGSICYAVVGAPLLFTGDTLFPGGPGATHFPGGDFATIMESLTSLFNTFADNTFVFPGHGDHTTIGTERPSLEGWRTLY